jgi:hypothetical protein
MSHKSQRNTIITYVHFSHYFADCRLTANPNSQFQCVSDYCAATPSKNRPHKLEVGLGPEFSNTEQKPKHQLLARCARRRHSAAQKLIPSWETAYRPFERSLLSRCYVGIHCNSDCSTHSQPCHSIDLDDAVGAHCIKLHGQTGRQPRAPEPSAELFGVGIKKRCAVYALH